MDQSYSPTILVVDDTPINLSVLVGILEGSGYRILVARNGPSALEIARRTRPDLMLLDIAMPEMNGFEVCRLMKNDPATADTIVIFLSALSDVNDKVSGLSLGAADYITKPFQSEEVLARVRGQLLRKQLERELRESRDHLAQELRSAGDMQKLLLPRNLPTCGNVKFSAHYQTSRHAGGDYYDVICLEDGKIGMFLADVAGHGARAAVLMAMIRTLLNSSGVPLDHPAELFTLMNHHFAYLKGTFLFATAIYAVIDPAAGRMRIACAGHPAPILIRSGEEAAELPCERTVPLFLFPERSVPESDHQIQQGDRIVFFTDGITERQNLEGDMLELERLISILERSSNLNHDHFVPHVINEINSFANGKEPQDDETILLAYITDL